MLFTVFVTGQSAREQWQAELLEYSWQQVQQPGELIRLVATNDAAAVLPLHSFARVIKTRSWAKHPYLPDQFGGYDKPAALLEWLFQNPLDASCLLLDSDSVLFAPIAQETEPGKAIGTPWQLDDTMQGQGPFGLSEDYRGLEKFCANVELKLAQVQFPVLIHASDLRQIAPRWLELTSMIRAEVKTLHGSPLNADLLAYNIAAAEYRIRQRRNKLAATSDAAKFNQAVLNYRKPIESARGEIVWDCDVYNAWQECQPERAKPGAGREFLAFLQEFITLRESGGQLRMRRPQRRYGVREARVVEQMILEIPDRAETLALNGSATVIWELCDNQRTLLDIVDEIGRRFDAPKTTLFADVEATAHHLRAEGAIELEPVHS